MARALGTQISDRAFLRALGPQFDSIRSFLDRTPDPGGPRFHGGPYCAPEEVPLVRAALAKARITAAADQVCAHVFDLLGSGPARLGTPIDWHTDFKTGYRWPRNYYTDIKYAPYPGGYDVKVPWELSRGQHLVRLGQAYWLSGDEHYAGEFVAQVLSWIESNPPRVGVNWNCTMDVALRAVNWLWAYHFCASSGHVTPAFRLVFFKTLLAHGRHIMANLEWSAEFTGNHYLSDIVGLVYLGLLLPEFREAEQWRDFGLRALESEMCRQVYGDGADGEASIAYHRLVAELFLLPAILSDLNGRPLGEPFRARLQAMAEFIMWVTRPDGAVPLIGDGDNGRLVRLGVWQDAEREWVDYRYLLAIAAVFFERPDFARAAGDQWQEAIWLFGEKALTFRQRATAQADSVSDSVSDSVPGSGFNSHSNSVSNLSSRAFADAGLYVLRHEDLFMIVDCGPAGQNGNGGHAHHDTLSFELFAQGQAWVVDPGTYVYTADYRARNRFRSPAYHNALTVADSSHDYLGDRRLFRLSGEPAAVVQCWVSGPDYDWLDACQTVRVSGGEIVQRRQILFDKQEGLWLVRDLVRGEGDHHLQWNWHCAAPVALDLATRAAPAQSAPEATLRMMPLALRVMSLTLDIVPLEDDTNTVWMTDSGWVSTSYGSRVEAAVLRRARQGCLPATCSLAFVPGSGDARAGAARLARARRRLDALLAGCDRGGDREAGV